MRALTATYRLQLREATTFAEVARLLPHLARLKISHLYLSPIMSAAPHSTHGYDVVDCNRIDESLGGELGFHDLDVALRDNGMGLIVDFVPNHMGISPENTWWYDVLEWGRASLHARYFDIDWSQPRLLLPVLGDAYGAHLARGEMGLAFDPKSGDIAFTLGDRRWPLSPPSYAGVLDNVSGAAEMARQFALATPEDATALKRALAECSSSSEWLAAFERHLEKFAADRDALHGLHERQVWRLAHWRMARDSLTYRRFFEISELVGLQVERPDVFRDAHRRLLELVRAGSIEGIRIDHIDGLADPTDYLNRLAAACESAPYVIVEKILGPEEELPSNWPVAGTTGYEFAKAVTEVLVEAKGEEELDAGYRAFLSTDVEYSALAAGCKRRILSENLAGELRILVEMAHALAAGDLCARDIGIDTLRSAIVEFAIALPVYRTYVDAHGAGEGDRRLIKDAVRNATASGRVENGDVFVFLERALTLDFDDVAQQVRALVFVRRLQQSTGPVMAKALEDTAFYRYNRLIALNEVGGEPEVFGRSIADFHAQMQRRAHIQPLGLSATSTHDTKRGEDARARLVAVSEVAADWVKHTMRWRNLNQHLAQCVAGRRYPDSATEWLLYQSLLGVWPMECHTDGFDMQSLEALSDRFGNYSVKAVREAKVFTSWTAPNSRYESAIEAFARGLLEAGRSRQFLSDFANSARPLIVAGALYSLSQTLIKLMAPGVPDVYQGAEGWDFSLVDPDNRRPVDFDKLAGLAERATHASPEAVLRDWNSAQPKLRLIARGLEVRSERPSLFADGQYVPLAVTGAHARSVIAFARCRDGDAVIAIAPRLVMPLLAQARAPLVPPERWDDTAVVLPTELAGLDWRDAISEAVFARTPALELRSVLARFPIAILTAHPTG